MKPIYVNIARVDLHVAQKAGEFFTVTAELPDALVDAIYEEQKRKFQLSDYLANVREAVRARTDVNAVELPDFLQEVLDNAEPEEIAKPRRGRPPRVPK
jgi:hypothetical protein